MRFRLNGKTYTAATLTRPTIRDYLNLTKETEALGRKLTSADVFALEQSVSECKSDAERAAHPDLLLFMALVIWASLIDAGEPDPFEQAISMRLDEIDFIDDPADHKPPADPTKARAGSARAAKSPAAAKRSRARTT